MSFLVWHNPWAGPGGARDALAAINTMYGCPLIAKNGYRMVSWDIPIQSNDGLKWGFYGPNAMLGKSRRQLMSAVRQASSGVSFHEHASRPDEFRRDDEDVV